MFFIFAALLVAGAHSQPIRVENIEQIATDKVSSFLDASPNQCAFLEDFCSVYQPSNCQEVLTDCPNRCANAFQCAQLYSALLKQTAVELNADKAPVVADLLEAKEQSGAGHATLKTTYTDFHDVEAALLLTKINLVIEGAAESPYSNLAQTAAAIIQALEQGTLARKELFFTLFGLNTVLAGDPDNAQALEDRAELLASQDLQDAVTSTKMMLPDGNSVTDQVASVLDTFANIGFALEFVNDPFSEQIFGQFYSMVTVGYIDLTQQQDLCARPTILGEFGSAETTACSNTLQDICTGGACVTPVFGQDAADPQPEDCAPLSQQCVGVPDQSQFCTCTNNYCTFIVNEDGFVGECIDETPTMVYDRLTAVAADLPIITLGPRVGDTTTVYCGSYIRIDADFNLNCLYALQSFTLHAHVQYTQFKQFTGLDQAVATDEIDSAPSPTPPPTTTAPSTTAPTDPPAVARVGDSSVLVAIAIGSVALLGCLLAIALFR